MVRVTFGPEECNGPFCRREAVAYGQCLQCAPLSWVRQLLEEDRDLLDADQREEARERLEEADA